MIDFYKECRILVKTKIKSLKHLHIPQKSCTFACFFERMLHAECSEINNVNKVNKLRI